MKNPWYVKLSSVSNTKRLYDHFKISEGLLDYYHDFDHVFYEGNKFRYISGTIENGPGETNAFHIIYADSLSKTKLRKKNGHFEVLRPTPNLDDQIRPQIEIDICNIFYGEDFIIAFYNKEEKTNIRKDRIQHWW
jgi:hypothetical protein